MQRQIIRDSVLLLSTGMMVLTGRGQEPQLVEPFVNSDGSFKAKLLTAPGQSYTVEISTNLATWVPKYCYTNVAGDITFVDPPGAGGGGRKFCRAWLGTAIVSRFSFHFSGYGGAWGERWVANPVNVEASAHFLIERAQDYPPAGQVLFSGPVGSGFSDSPAVVLSGWEYASKPESEGLPVVGGQWSVQFHGSTLSFEVPDPRVGPRLVIPFPAVAEEPGGVIVSWTYVDAVSGAALGGPPAFLTSVQVGITDARSGVLPPGTTEYVFPSLVLPRGATVVISYGDTFGNVYSVRFSELKP